MPSRTMSAGRPELENLTWNAAQRQGSDSDILCSAAQAGELTQQAI